MTSKLYERYTIEINIMQTQNYFFYFCVRQINLMHVDEGCILFTSNACTLQSLFAFLFFAIMFKSISSKNYYSNAISIQKQDTLTD